jgi:hypothetical protein
LVCKKADVDLNKRYGHYLARGSSKERADWNF